MQKKSLRTLLLMSIFAVGLTACGSSDKNMDKSGEKKTEMKTEETKKEEKKDDKMEKKGAFKDGEYTSDLVKTEHGDLQIKVIIKEGVIANIEALKIPDADDSAKRVNGAAVPEYIKLALEKQNYDVDKVSGATYTHETFNKALKSALDQAK